MTQEKKHTNDIFKNKFKDFNIEPAPAVWDNIESSMLSSRRKKIILTPLIGIAASLVLLAIPTWFYYFNPFTGEETTNTILAEKESPVIKTEKIEETDNTETVKTEQSIDSGAGKSENIEEEYLNVNKGDNKLAVKETVKKQPGSPDSNYSTTIKRNKGNDIIIANTSRKVIVPVGGISDENSFLAINANIKFPKKLNYNNEIDRIRFNLAQINKAKDKYTNSSKIQLDLGQARSVSGPGYNYPTRENILKMTDFATVESRVIKLTKPSVKLTTDIGIHVDIPINKRLSFVSGIRYLSYKDDKERSELAIPVLGTVKDIDRSIITIDSKIIKEIDQSFANIEIPLQLKYYIFNKKLSIFVSGGLGYNILIKNNADIIYEDNSVVKSETEDLSKSTYSGILGLGISYKVSNKIYLSIEPRYRHYFKSFSNNADIEIKPNITNLSFGLGFIF